MEDPSFAHRSPDSIPRSDLPNLSRENHSKYGKCGGERSFRYVHQLLALLQNERKEREEEGGEGWSLEHIHPGDARQARAARSVIGNLTILAALEKWHFQRRRKRIVHTHVRLLLPTYYYATYF